MEALSVHAARALEVVIMKNHEPPRLCIEVNVPRRGRKLAVLRLHHNASLQAAAEATVCFNQFFGDVNIFYDNSM